MFREHAVSFVLALLSIIKRYQAAWNSKGAKRLEAFDSFVKNQCHPETTEFMEGRRVFE